VFHPDLQALFGRYDELVDAAEQGLMSVDEAMTTLASMVVVDAAGVEWRLDANGQLYSSLPGSQPLPADPKMFTPASSVTGIPMPWSPSRTPSTNPSSLYAPPSLPPQGEPSPYGAPPVGVVPHPVIPAPKRTLPKITLQPGRARTLAVVAGCVLAVFILINSQGGEEPVVTDTPIVTETVDGAVPKSEITTREAKKVVAALSGTQSGAALAVTAVNDAEMLDVAMPFAAAARLGYDVTVTDVTSNEEGGTSAVVTVSFDGERISTWLLPLETVDDRVIAAGNAVRQ